MIRLLTAVLLLTYSLFGWASAYPVDYDNMINHNNGDIIKAEDFNNNNNIHKQNIINLKESIDTIEAGTGPQGPQGEQGPAGPQGEQGPSGADGIAAGLTCTTDQIIKYDGSGWVCADMPSGGGGAGTRVWRDADGNLFPEEDGRYVLYRFPEYDYVFQIWNYIDDRYSNQNLWFNTPDCSGQPVTRLTDQDSSRSWIRGTRTSTHWLLPDFNASEIAFSGTANNSSFLRGFTGECETLTYDASFAALPMIQSSAPLDLITPPIELIWE